MPASRPAHEPSAASILLFLAQCAIVASPAAHATLPMGPMGLPAPADAETMGRAEPAPLPDRLRSIDALISNGELVEADVAAKLLVEHILSEPAADQSMAALALGRLALVQHLAGDQFAAAQNYTAAIEQISRTNNRLSPLLVDPLSGLAAAQRAGGDSAAAVASYERALHISHVNYGPHSLAQAGLLNELLDTALAENDSDAAFAMLNRLQRLYERNYSSRSIELVPVLRQRAQLLRSLGRFSEERQIHRDIVLILIEAEGRDTPALIDTYQALADTYRNEVNGVVFRSEPTTENGETWLRRALEIAEIRRDAEPRIVLDRLLALGDYYMLLDTQDKARAVYQRAWRMVSSNPPEIPDQANLLAEPRLLGRPVLSPYADFAYGWELDHVTRDELLQGYVTAQYTVTRRGHVSNIAIIDAEPAGFEPMEVRVKRSLRDFIFRPRFEGGRPVATRKQIFRHEYEYRRVDLQQSQGR